MHLQKDQKQEKVLQLGHICLYLPLLLSHELSPQLVRIIRLKERLSLSVFHQVARKILLELFQCNFEKMLKAYAFPNHHCVVAGLHILILILCWDQAQ